MTRVCLGIPTFRRLDTLRELLTALGRLEPLPEHVCLEVVVFDNDPQANAEAVVTACRSVVPFELGYEHVAQPGLASVRNAALDHAALQANVLAMIDDDEIPEPQWLAELLRVQAATGATVVVGPVRAILPVDAPSWFRAFREREYPSQSDGASLRDGWSSNFSLDLRQVSKMALRFDSAMNLTGGEDQLYFRQILAAGGVIRYAANAIVWERLPPSRRSFPSILQRSFRRGGSLTMCDRRVRANAGTLIVRFAKGGGLVTLGLAKVLPTLLVRGVTPAIMTLCEIARGFGMLAALFGIRHEAYGRVA